MDRVGDLALFLRVLDLGSITAAAHSLDLSVAVASQRLKRLEKELGVRLLHRTTRRLHPTPEGAALAEQGGCWWRSSKHWAPACAKRRRRSPAPCG